MARLFKVTGYEGQSNDRRFDWSHLYDATHTSTSGHEQTNAGRLAHTLSPMLKQKVNRITKIPQEKFFLYKALLAFGNGMFIESGNRLTRRSKKICLDVDVIMNDETHLV